MKKILINLWSNYNQKRNNLKDKNKNIHNNVVKILSNIKLENENIK
jgi:hypothetical protein